MVKVRIIFKMTVHKNSFFNYLTQNLAISKILIFLK